MKLKDIRNYILELIGYTYIGRLIIDFSKARYYYTDTVSHIIIQHMDPPQHAYHSSIIKADDQPIELQRIRPSAKLIYKWIVYDGYGWVNDYSEQQQLEMRLRVVPALLQQMDDPSMVIDLNDLLTKTK